MWLTTEPLFKNYDDGTVRECVSQVEETENPNSESIPNLNSAVTRLVPTAYMQGPFLQGEETMMVVLV